MNNNLYRTQERVLPGGVSIDAYTEHCSRYIFASKLVSGKKILDLACGTGHGFKILSDEKPLEYIGVDSNKQSIEYAKLCFLKKNNSFLVSDAQNLPFKDNYFDVIVSFETLEHISGYLKVIQEFNKVLKKDGVLVISSPNKAITGPNLTKPLNKYHAQEWYFDEILKILGNYFSVSEIYGQNFMKPVNANYALTQIFSSILDFIPIPLLKWIKLYVLKYKKIEWRDITIKDSLQIKPAEKQDFYTDKNGKAYAIQLFILKKY